MGAGLWAGGFCAGAVRAWKDGQFDGGGGAGCSRGCGILSGDLLVFAAESAGQKRISRDRSEGKRHSRKYEGAGPVAALFEDGQLLVVPSARGKGDAGNPEELGAF